MEKVYYSRIKTSEGILWAAATVKGLLQINRTKELLLGKHGQNMKRIYVEQDCKFKKLRAWMDSFYQGKPVKYEEPLDMRGTDFQKKVWKAILRIPYGRLTSYGQIAKDIGSPKAARAVGNAVGSNPLGPVVPCHRVVWSNGGIGGFGGGLERKRKLLYLEGVLPTVKGIPEKYIDLRRFFYS